jgi:branched-chain amino acid transport system permease protein
MLKIIIINGLITGGQYAILSIGFSLVFGTAKILNLAHTTFYMIAAFLLLYGTTFLKLSYGTSAVLLAIPIATLSGLLCYKIFFDRIKEHQVTVIIMASGLVILFQEVLLILFEGHYRGIPSFLPGYLEIMNVRMTYQQLFSMVMCFITIMGVWVLLSHTKLGNAIRAVSQDREAAIVLGMNVNRICLITMGISSALAGIAAIAVAPIVVVHPLMWMHPIIVVLASVVLGGLGSIKGVIIASFILALTESAVTGLIPNGSFLKGVFSLGIMVIFLLFRPEGLFGVVFEEERL